MKSVVHKYQLNETKNTFALPAGASALDVQLQDGIPTVWIEKPTEDHLPQSLVIEPRTFHVIMTGQEFEFENYTNFRYLATLQMPPGIVGHIYEEYKP